MDYSSVVASLVLAVTVIVALYLCLPYFPKAVPESCNFTTWNLHYAFIALTFNPGIYWL